MTRHATRHTGGAGDERRGTAARPNPGGAPPLRLLLLGLALVACAPATIPPRTLPLRPPASAWPHSFALLTLNAFLLPEPWFPFDQRRRAQLLVEHLSGYDAIVFQELFDDGARAVLLSGLADEYPYATRLVGRRDGPLREAGGVVIVSRWPIEAEAQTLFGDLCAGVDCFADKGVVYARIAKGSRRYHVFGTHAQSDAFGAFPAVREAQFRLFGAFVEAQRIPPDDAVLLAGDFNVDCRRAEAFERMLRALDAAPPQPCGDLVTWDGPGNELAPSGVRLRLDYILVARRHRRPFRARVEVLPLRSERYGRRDLSDHYAVSARFLFGPFPLGPLERPPAGSRARPVGENPSR